MGKTLTLTRHLRAGRLPVHCTVRRARAWFAFVSYICGTCITIETLFATVAEDAGSVVNALEALARLSVTVAHSIGVDVVIAAAGTACPDWTIFTKRVPKEAIIT